MRTDADGWGREFKLAVDEGDADGVRALLASRPRDYDLDAAIAGGGATALMCASWRGYFEMVELLVVVGCDASRRDHHGRTAALYGRLTEEKRDGKELVRAARLFAACRPSAPRVGEYGLNFGWGRFFGADERQRRARGYADRVEDIFMAHGLPSPHWAEGREPCVWLTTAEIDAARELLAELVTTSDDDSLIQITVERRGPGVPSPAV